MRFVYLGLAALVFFGAAFLDVPLKRTPLFRELPDSLPHLRRMLISAAQLSVVALGVGLTHHMRARDVLKELGLAAPVLPALGFALVCTAPMFLAYGLAPGVRLNDSFGLLLQQSFTTPFAEEVLFRGYLFLQLHRRARLRFWPANLAVAALFGAGHAYQALSGDGGWGALSGVFVLTGLGSVLFSWLLLRWDTNLWVPIWMHGLMNAAWHLFTVDETALGDGLANAARLATVALAVALTVSQRRLHLPLSRVFPAPAGPSQPG